MTIDSPYWVCAYGNNQWSLSGDITKDPLKSGFNKAIEIANGRTVTILDGGDCTTMKRTWCVFEVSRATDVKRESRVWAIYTAHVHKRRSGDEYSFTAVGIVSGGATGDNAFSPTAAREGPFPLKLIEQSYNVNIESAEASVEADKKHILNSLAGRRRGTDQSPPVLQSLGLHHPCILCCWDWYPPTTF